LDAFQQTLINVVCCYGHVWHLNRNCRGASGMLGAGARLLDSGGNCLTSQHAALYGTQARAQAVV